MIVEPVYGVPGGVRLIDLIDSGILEDHVFELLRRGEVCGAEKIWGIGPGNLSDAARTEWADVLCAPVCGIRSWLITMGIALDIDRADRLRDFVMAYTGHCNSGDFERWFPETDIEFFGTADRIGGYND